MADGTDPTKDWMLVITQRGQSSHMVPFTPGVVFGRSSTCSYVLNDATVSGNHAHITKKDGAFVIEDLGSENKTKISGGPVLGKGESFVLSPGTVFQMGRTFVELRSEEAFPNTAMIDPPSADGTSSDSGDSQLTVAGGLEDADETRGHDEIATDPAVGSEPDFDATMMRPEPAEANADETAARPILADPVAEAPRPQQTPPVAQAQAPPEPAPAAEPVAAPSSTQAKPNLTDSDYLGTIDFGAGGGSGLHAKLAAQGSLQAARARLVVAGQMDRRIDAIDTATFSIGRGKDSQCRLSHPAISTPHATITFKADESRFFIQDDGSRNHTYLSGQMLPPGVQQELKSNAHVRFGPVDALFVVEIDPDGVKIPEKRQDLAAQLLVENGTITAAAKTAAVKLAVASDQQLGETLLLSPEPVSVKQWVEALEQAKYLEISGGLRGQQRRVWVIAAAAVALITLIVIIMSLL